jgi:hypothetical protein
MTIGSGHRPVVAIVQHEEQQDETRFTNFFVHCRQEWEDEWSCMCNDRCPVCNREIEPYASWEQGDPDPNMHVGSDWIPEQGLPEGVGKVAELAGWPDSARK